MAGTFSKPPRALPFSMFAPIAANSTLPAIPGGWTTRTVRVGHRSLRVTLPAEPDAFLDDPAVLAANRQSDYMPYWSYLWPAALEMANFVGNHTWPPGDSALEIGAGIGLVGLAGWYAGLEVNFSDYDPTAVTAALYNARQNGFPQARGFVIDWQTPPPLSTARILACDVLYEQRQHQPLLRFLDRVLIPDGVAWFGDPGRHHAAAFVERARQDGFEVELRSASDQRVTDLPPSEFRVIAVRRDADDRE